MKKLSSAISVSFLRVISILIVSLGAMATFTACGKVTGDPDDHNIYKMYHVVVENYEQNQQNEIILSFEYIYGERRIVIPEYEYFNYSEELPDFYISNSGESRTGIIFVRYIKYWSATVDFYSVFGKPVMEVYYFEKEQKRCFRIMLVLDDELVAFFESKINQNIPAEELSVSKHQLLFAGSYRDLKPVTYDEHGVQLYPSVEKQLNVLSKQAETQKALPVLEEDDATICQPYMYDALTDTDEYMGYNNELKTIQEYTFDSNYVGSETERSLLTF